MSGVYFSCLRETDRISMNIMTCVCVLELPLKKLNLYLEIPALDFFSSWLLSKEINYEFQHKTLPKNFLKMITEVDGSYQIQHLQLGHLFYFH